MTFGLVNVSFSLPEWQAVKMTFFAPCTLLSFFSVLFCHVFIYKVVLFIIVYNDTCKLSQKVKNAKMCHMCIYNVHKDNGNTSNTIHLISQYYQ